MDERKKEQTERNQKKGAEKIKISEERYKSLYDAAPIAIGLATMDGKIISMNQAMHDAIGYTIEELNEIGLLNTYVNPDDRVILMKKLKEFGKVRAQEVTLRRKNGMEYTALLNIDKMEIKGVTMLHTIMRDITKRKQVEQKLRESEERFRRIIENAPFGYYRVGKNGSWQYVNPVWEHMHGFSLEEVVGKNFEMTQPEDAKEQARENVRRALLGETITGEFERKRKDGTIEYHSFNIQPVYQEGEIVAIEGFINDITERKKAEQELQKLNEELEERVKKRTRESQKSEEKYRLAYEQTTFYKDLLTHDINNILHNIHSSLELYSLYREKPTTTSEEKEALINIIREQEMRGEKLVSNVRKLSQLEEANIILENTEACKMLKKAIEFIHKSFQEREIKVNITSIDKTLFVHANTLLLDVFENILHNAVKYNDNSPVEILIRISKKQEGERNLVKMEFLDNGIGMLDAQKQHIFQRGHDEHKGGKGMGFGLSLVKKIMESYKGKIWVEDRVKGDYTKGSNFVLLIPEAI